MKPHEEWLYKADNDIESSKVLAAIDAKLYDTAIYHTQQCAEKALKAFLASHEIEIIKTHDLKLLLKKCSLIDDSFEVHVEAANFLNPFISFFRYPGFETAPDRETTLKAIVFAEEILVFVKNKIL